MCGIVGAFSFNNGSFTVTESYLTAMRDTMIHRGPDGFGTWISEDSKVGFGHRRLSIIDLSEAAAQPMCNANRSLWLTFNGEIYNHAEIRSELIKDGFNQWKTDHSDTEVILHAYERWGIDALHKEWFLDRLGAQTQKELKSFCDETDFIHYSEIQRLIERRQSPLIWSLFNLALWWKKYFA